MDFTEKRYRPHSSILHNHTEYSIAQIAERIKGYGEISHEKVDEIRCDLPWAVWFFGQGEKTTPR